MFAGLFGETPKPLKEQAREWDRQLKREMRAIDRESKKIEREESKIVREVKRLAKKPGVNKQSLTTLSKSLIKSRKQRERMMANKAHLNSVALSIRTQVMTQQNVKIMGKTTAIMQGMNHLVKVPQVAAVCREMSKEMMKAGIMEEMMDDAFETLDDEDLDELAEQEVDNVLFEITSGAIGIAPVSGNTLKTPEVDAKEQEVDLGELEEMKARLDKLQV